MKLLTFLHDGKARPGILAADGSIIDLSDHFASLLDIFAGGARALAAATAQAERAGPRHAPGAVTLLAPISRPLKNVFCVGRNYLDHVKEGAAARLASVDVPEVPQFFTKPPTAVVGPGAGVIADERVSTKMDYEGELGVVIGTAGRDIAATRALDHVFGYTIVNDVTARDLQRRHGQWFKGKGLDTSCPMGPVIVTADEVPDPGRLVITTHINGEERQNASVSLMIFDIPAIIASLSAGLTLELGDVIATGTPAGVGFAMDPPRYLKPGDRMAITITGIGTLENPVVGR